MHRISCAVAAAACLLTLGGCTDNPTVPAGTRPVQVSVVAASTGIVLSGKEIPILATVSDRGRPYPNFLLNFNVVAGGGHIFGGAELTNNKGEARDIWLIGFGSCQLNTLAVRAVDASTGVGTTYFTQTVATLGKISFYRRGDDGNPEIYVMNVDGSNQTRLTYNPTQDLSSDWSPDGRKIVFQSDRRGVSDIYVMNEDGTNQTRLTSGPGGDIDPSWSPDGRMIAFRRNGDIFVMNADGFNPVNLTNSPGANNHPRWSPDGSKIVFNSRRDGNDEIYVMDAEDGSNPTRLTFSPASELNPAWSNDGSKIAFDSDLGIEGGPRDIVVMNADGSNPVNVTNNPASDTWPGWSPDGRKIVFDSNRGLMVPGYFEIYVMNADGSNPVNLSNFPARNARPAWSRCVPAVN